MLKKVVSIVLVLLLLLPNLTLANGVIGPENPDKNISRAEMATVAVRLLGLEDLKDDYDKKGNFKDVKGWPLPYINIASEEKVMTGRSKDVFDPNGKLTYVEVLTALLRILGYEDGIDFKNYPTDHYNLALEIGLGNVYIKHKQVITRKEASDTVDRALDLNMKESETSLSQYLIISQGVPGMETNVEDYTIIPDTPKEITMANLNFNSSIVGAFSGELKGSNDFTNYKVELLSKGGQVYKTRTLSKSGNFKITGFDIDIMSKLSGYMYKIYDAKGNMILSADLQ